MAKPQKKQDEKNGQQQDTTIKVPPDLKETLDGLKEDRESYADVIKRLAIQKAASDIPDDGMVSLKMTGKSYRMLLMAIGSSPALSEILWNARVT